MIVVVLAMAVGVAGTLGLVLLAVPHVVRPIKVLSGTIRELGSGNLAAEVGGVDRGDELGDMARAMLAFRNQIQVAEDAKQAQGQLIVESLGTGLVAIAKGDLTAELDADLQAPFIALKDNFNDTVVGLRALISSVSESAAMISTGSHEIAQASEDLARRTEGNQAQSTAIVEISSAVNAMDQATQQNAAMVEQTSAAARNLTSDVAALSEQAKRFEVTGQTRRASAPPLMRAAPKAAVRAAPVLATAGAGGDDWSTF